MSDHCSELNEGLDVRGYADTAVVRPQSGESLEEMVERIRAIGDKSPRPEEPLAAPVERPAPPDDSALTREILARPCTDWEKPLIATLRRHRGIENAITSEELGALVHVPGRQIRSRINHLRAVHHLAICANPTANKTSDRKAGYYWPKSIEEFTVWLSRARRTQIEERLAIDGAERGAEEDFGTMNLFPVGGGR